jgi:hypothetical protein
MCLLKDALRGRRFADAAELKGTVCELLRRFGKEFARPQREINRSWEKRVVF